MAEYSSSSSDPSDPLAKEANERLAAARKQKREFEPDIRESYFFSAPHRARQINSEQALNESKPTDADLLQVGDAFELVEDFCTEVLDAFMPEAAPWAERRPGMFVPADLAPQIKEAVTAADAKIFEAIRASNLYEEITKAWNPDLAIGLTALWVDDPRPAENIVVQAVPLHEIEVNLGPFGSIDDRFVVRHTKNRHVRALLGEAIYGEIDEKCRQEIERSQDERTVVVWGYWRKWERRDDVVWQHVILLKDKRVHEGTLVGEGSCPLIPTRWNPSPEWAFGTGPMIKSLPDMRQLDEIAAKRIEHIDNALAPPSTYPDDSFVAVEQGIESGKVYPVRPGSESAVKPIFPPGSIEAALFETSEIERKLKRRFFADFPEQRGDTPPTATQWIDEMERKQRRIGTPGKPFWKEGPAEIFLRFKYLLEDAGVIEKVTVNGKNVSLQPYNPAQRAAEQQEVAMAARFAQLAAPLFPEEWRLKVDGGATIEAIAEKMRVTGLIQFRTEQQQKQAIDQISQLMEGRQQIRPGDPSAAGSL